MPESRIDSRIDRAVARIEAALARLDAARAGALLSAPPAAPATGGKEPGGAARVMELVNRHEKLREEVADTLRDLDALIAGLEG